MMANISVISFGDSSSQDEDSDDNFLYVQPAALVPDSPPSRRPIDSFKKENSPASDHVEPAEDSAEDHSPPDDVKRLKYSLDRIVQANTFQDKKDAGLSNLQESLRHGIIEGGINKLIQDEEDKQRAQIKTEPKEHEVRDDGVTASETENNEDTALLPEHEETLQHYALQNERIATVHPGEEVFCNADLGKLFTFPVQLSLPYKPNAMEKLVITSSTEELKEILMSRTIVDIYQMRRCPDAVMLWLFQLLSICDHVMVAGAIFDTMWSLATNSQRLFPNEKPWCPSLQDIATVFVNYGAKLDTLIPPLILKRHFNMEDIMQRCGNQDRMIHQESVGTRPSSIPLYNLQQVIKILTHCLLSHNKGLPLGHEDLTSLMYMVCKVALDKQLVRCAMMVDFHHCIAAILNCFEDDIWKVQAGEICRFLTSCSDHHHNLVHLVRLMRTGTQRGQVVCSRLSYAILKHLSGKSEHLDQEGYNEGVFKVSHLIPLLIACKPKQRSQIDYYRLHSLVTLVELGVGYDKELFQSSDKEALAQLVTMLRDMAGDIRESHKDLCRTQVKDLIFRIASKLTYLEQMLTSKQMFLHTFWKPTCTLSDDTAAVQNVEISCQGNEDEDGTCLKVTDDDISNESDVGDETLTER